jgi:hypothetical protein
MLLGLEVILKIVENLLVYGIPAVALLLLALLSIDALTRNR